VRGDRELTVAVVYPSLLGTYGDAGNALVLQRRLQWRGLRARLVAVEVGEPVPEHCDVYVLGGAEDGAGRTAADMLAGDRGLRRAVAAGRPVLAVCAGLQILGHEVRTHTGQDHAGLGLLDLTTAPRAARAIGEVTGRPVGGWSADLLSGFENHRGSSVLGSAARPLATVLSGVGNGAGEPVEGAVQGSIVATYLHGPVLARNPALADWLLESAVGEALEPLEVESVTRLRAERLGAVRAHGRVRGRTTTR
jgi:CobQ-like glutamine amidotransferase family enzyme